MLLWNKKLYKTYNDKLFKIMKIRVLYNLILVRLGIRDIFPSCYIHSRLIEECGEELVELSAHDKIYINYEKQLDPVLLRKTVAEKILRIADSLPDDLMLLIHSAYRTMEQQKRLWQRSLKIAQDAHPDASEKELYLLSQKFSSNPTTGIGGGHQTGGAIDIEICIKKSFSLDFHKLDFGTEYGEHSDNTPTYSRKITKVHKKKRRILCKLMESENFVNYPGEWWHFSYGDKMWAAYGNKKKAIYETI